MVQVDDEFMVAVGLDEMPEDDKKKFMEQAEEELEVRVGQEIGRNLSNEQLEEFGKITDSAEAVRWLEMMVPDFREIVAGVFLGFRDEIKREMA